MGSNAETTYEMYIAACIVSVICLFIFSMALFYIIYLLSKSDDRNKKKNKNAQNEDSKESQQNETIKFKKDKNTIKYILHAIVVIVLGIIQCMTFIFTSQSLIIDTSNFGPIFCDISYIFYTLSYISLKATLYLFFTFRLQMTFRKTIFGNCFFLFAFLFCVCARQIIACTRYPIQKKAKFSKTSQTHFINFESGYTD